MRDVVIGNLLKTALSHILKSHIFSFAVSVFVVINSLVKQILDFPFFSLSILVPRAAILLASATDRELWQEPILQSAIRGLPVNCAAARFIKCRVERKWLVKGLLIYFTKL